FGTVAWGVHLMGDHEELLEGDILDGEDLSVQSLNPLRGIAMTTGLSVTDVAVRAALVNIAGMSRQKTYASVGSGVIVNPKGYVFTAHHLVKGLSDIHVRVQTPYGPRQYAAKIVKAAPEHDVVLLKLITQDVFPYLLLDLSQPLRVGEQVKAWGDPTGTEAVNLHGVIQGIARNQPVMIGKMRLTHVIATSAVTHWAQSGGPLVNMSGRLVGINLAIQDPSGRVIGYAIPAQVLHTHFQEIINFAPPSPGRAALTPNTPAKEPVLSSTGGALTGGETFTKETTGETTGRPSDLWWKKARLVAQSELGQNAAVTQTVVPDGASGKNVTVDPTHNTDAPRIFGYSASSFAGLLMLGFVAGISGGMMTMGGGIIKVTGLMLFFGYGLVLVRPIAYITNIFIYGAAAVRYRNEGLTRFRSLKSLVPWAVVGVIVGYFIGNILNKTTIQILLGVFALLLGIKMFLEIFEYYGEKRAQKTAKHTDDLSPLDGLDDVAQHAKPGAKKTESTGTTLLHGLMGLPMGVISGILGITGGVVEVPLQRYVAGIPLRVAIANSATLVFFASLAGSVVALIHGVQTGSFELSTPLIMAAILIPGSYVGGRVGAWLTTVAPLNALRWLYAILMLVIAGRMILWQ
ncbi:TSUP family transporter, partial [Magnetococcales bacterium HHB-1]